MSTTESAKTIKIDYSACESLLRFVFSTTEIGGASSLADWINSKPKDFDRKLWVKPKGQATHAVATRQTGGNAIPLDEVDWFKSPFVRAVNALHEPYPEMLRGRYHPNPTITEKCAVIYPVLQMYRKTEPMLRAKAMLDHIFDPPMVADSKGGKRPQRIWEAYGYEHDEWQNHADRKIWDDVRQKLRSLMQPAIEAWVAECRRRDLDV